MNFEKMQANPTADPGLKQDLEPQRTKRTYVPPELIEYGSVQKLTQAGGLSVLDGIGLMMACL